MVGLDKSLNDKNQTFVRYYSKVKWVKLGVEYSGLVTLQ